MINKVDPNGEKMDYCTRLWITRNIFIYDRYFFSQAIKNSGSKWRRWIIVVANLEFNFWERFFFSFLFVSSVPNDNWTYSISVVRNVLETNGGQARIRLVYIGQLSSGHFYSSCGQRGVTANKTISRQKLVKWKIILVFFRLVFFSFFRWNTSNSWNLNDRCATAQLSRAQTVGNS